MRCVQKFIVALALTYPLSALAGNGSIDEKAWDAFLRLNLYSRESLLAAQPLVCDIDAALRRIESMRVPPPQDSMLWLLNMSLGRTLPVDALSRYPKTRGMIAGQIERSRANATTYAANCVGRETYDLNCTQRFPVPVEHGSWSGFETPFGLPAAIAMLRDHDPTRRARAIEVFERVIPTTEAYRLLDLLHDREVVTVAWSEAVNDGMRTVRMPVADLASFVLETLITYSSPARVASPDRTETAMLASRDRIDLGEKDHALHFATARVGPDGSRVVWIWSFGPDKKPGGGDDIIREIDEAGGDGRWIRATGGVVDADHAPRDRATPFCPITPLPATR